MKLSTIRYFTFIIMVLISVSQQGFTQEEVKPDYTPETNKERGKRFRDDCYLEELGQREGYKKCKEIFDGHTKGMTKDQLSGWKKIFNKKMTLEDKAEWKGYKCPQVFSPEMAGAFRKSRPESCVPYGELMEENLETDKAEKAYLKACGYFFSPSKYKKNEKSKQKQLYRLKEYGCVTGPMSKKYGLDGFSKCSTARLLGCVRLSHLYIGKEELDKSKFFMQRSCDGGMNESCEQLKNKAEESNLIYYTSVLLIGFVVFLITNLMFQKESQFQAGDQLDEMDSKDEADKHGIVLKYSRPMFKRYVSPIVSAMKQKEKIREKYKHPLAGAGLSEYLTPEDFFSFKLFLILGFPILFMAIRTFLEESWPLTLVPVVAVVGFFYPDIWVKGKMEQRQLGVLSGMPFAVDMLALSVEAGLDFIAAMSKVVEKAKPGPLVEEFEILIKEIKIGSSRAEALRNMAWRVNSMEISSFCATLIAADSVGASIGPILKSLSDEIRQKASSEVEKKGATAATKILFPMLFLITPAVFIIVAAPMALGFMNR